MPEPKPSRGELSGHFESAPAEVVAHALSRISDPKVSLFARIKVGGDGSSSGEIERTIWLEVCNKYGRAWIKPGKHRKDLVRAMVRVALFEQLYGPVCPDCLGTRFESEPVKAQVRKYDPRAGHFNEWVEETTVLVPCERCRGTGRRPWTEGDRAEMLGLKYSTFCSTWRTRLEAVAVIVRRFEAEILEARL